MELPSCIFLIIVVAVILGWLFAKICPEDDPINNKKEPPTLVRK